ncbi:MAG: hypothetical protein ACE5D7_03205 [Fidelibacterota bacterium]
MKSSSVIAAIFIFQIVYAVPRFSLENGASCNLCHVNPTGGGQRNNYGSTIFSFLDLPHDSPENDPWDGTINDFIKIGGEFRIQSLIHENDNGDMAVPIFPMQADLTTFISPVDNFSIYGNIQLAGGGLNDFWGMYSGFPGETWLRFGRFVPDFGLKLDDHTAFIRGGNIRLTHGLSDEGLFFSPTLLPTGIEIGTKIWNGFRLTSGIFNSFVEGGDPNYGFNERISDKFYSFKANWVKSYFEILHTMNAVSILKESSISAIGISGGISINHFSWQYEFDRVRNAFQDMTSSLAVFHEFSFSPVQGFSILGRYEFFDPDRNNASGAIKRFILGTEFFPRYGIQSIVQIRLIRTENISTNQAKPELLYQLHYWF